MASHLSDEQLRSLRERLLDDRDTLRQRLRTWEASGLDQSLSASLGELSAYDNHPADTGDELYERGKDLALRAMLTDRLGEIDAALARMDAGRYGVCVACGRPISYARLLAKPEASRCTRCETRDVSEHESR